MAMPLEASLRILNPVIGVMDSGHGGLTVVKQLDRVFQGTGVNISYIGDAQFFPYGNRPTIEIIRYSARIINYLSNVQGASVIDIACNSASAALNPGAQHIEALTGRPIIGMIEAGSSMAMESSANGRIGVIGTTATINSMAYQTALSSLGELYGRRIEVIGQACPALAQKIENGDVDSQETYALLQHYLSIFSDRIDTLVMGCTHYPFARSAIRQILGEYVTLVDPAVQVANITYSLLDSMELISRGQMNHGYQFTTPVAGSVADLTWQDHEKIKFWERLTGLQIEATSVEIPLRPSFSWRGLP